MIETKFKNSEVGLIPEDWDVKALGILFDMIPNNTLSRECLNYSKGDYQNVHYGDVLIKFSEYVDCEQELLPFINSECKFNKTLLQDGDVVMADTAEDETAGKVTEVVNLDNKKVVSGLHTIPLHPKKKFASKFLGYAMNASSYHKQLYALQSGTKVTSVSKSSIITTKLAFSRNITEQSRIAEALSDVDDLISTTKKLIEKKLNIKQGAMQELLSGKRRLSGFTKGWVTTEVVSITGKISRGQTLKSDEFCFGIIPVMAGGKQYAGFHNKANQKGRSITISGSGASAGFVYLHNAPIFATDCSVIAESDSFSLDFMYYLLSYRQEDLYKLQTGGAQPHVYPRDIENIEIFVPTLKDEQQAIANVLSDMDSEISSLESRLTKYQSLKQGMMQQLLTGKIRLI